MRFLSIIKLGKREVIAFVGAGGKTSTIGALAKEAVEDGLKTILTTTTKIYLPDNLSQKVVIISDSPQVLRDEINKSLINHKEILIATKIEEKEGSPPKIVGLNKELFKVLNNSTADLILVEADGAARKPFKAPTFHEPVIPEAASLVIPVVGIECIGKPLTSEYVHRPEVVAQLTGASIGEEIRPETVAQVFTSPEGYFKDVPKQARWIPFINKVETPRDLALAREIGRLIRQKVQVPVLIGACLEEDPVKEVME